MSGAQKIRTKLFDEICGDDNDKEEKEELKFVKIECPKCGFENIVAFKRIVDLSDPVRCSSCGEKVVIFGETTVVFEDDW